MKQEDFQDELLQRMDDVHKHEVYYDAMTFKMAEQLEKIANRLGVIAYVLLVGLGVLTASLFYQGGFYG